MVYAVEKLVYNRMRVVREEVKNVFIENHQLRGDLHNSIITKLFTRAD